MQPTDFRNLLSLQRLPLLDGIRAISVLVVIAAHFGYAVPSDLGVTAFFVLSGFLITWLLLREHDNTGDISLQGFYLRRTLRIFPAYYAFLALAFAWDMLRGEAWPPRLLLAGVTYTVNYFNAFNGHPDTSIAHAWSLGVEEQFYLLWPLGFILLMRRSQRVAAWGLAGAIVLSCAWRAYAWAVLDLGASYAYNAFECRVDGIALGCLLAIGARLDGFRRAIATLSSRAWAPLPTFALLAASRLATSGSYHYTVGFTIDAALIALAMTQMLHFPAHRLWSWLDSAPARWMGAISYPMYLYHSHALSVAHRAPGPGLFQFVVGVAVTAALATVSYRLLELPILRMRPRIERLLPSRAAAERAARAAA
jgi:peptidoglycan/LPS O-acetylase OafA/YrhL